MEEEEDWGFALLLVEEAEDRFDGVDCALVDERLVEPLQQRLELFGSSYIAQIRVRSNSL